MIRMTIGKLIRDLRKEKKLTQITLASKLEVTQRRVSYWESDKYEPTYSELKKIAKFFQISYDELFE